MAEIIYDASSHCYKCGEQWRSVLVCGCPRVSGPACFVWVQDAEGVRLEDELGDTVGTTELVGGSGGIYVWDSVREAR